MRGSGARFARSLEALRSRPFCGVVCPSQMGVVLAMMGVPAEKVILFEGNLSMRLMDMRCRRRRRRRPG